uniref:Uncharacterized protein n=1 Tax=Arundo donax TaxID=35708 RepID=A0A0A9E588_ARUDO
MRYWHPFTEEAIEQVGPWHISKTLVCSVDFPVLDCLIN